MHVTTKSYKAHWAYERMGPSVISSLMQSSELRAYGAPPPAVARAPASGTLSASRSVLAAPSSLINPYIHRLVSSRISS